MISNTQYMKEAQQFDTGDRVILQAQVSVQRNAKSRIFEFHPEDEFVVVRQSARNLLYVVPVKTPWIGVFELSGNSFCLSDN